MAKQAASGTRRDLFDSIRDMLDKTPGQSIRELAIKLKTNRTYLAGYLMALEDYGYVSSRNVGPARVYFNKPKEVTR